MNKKIKIQIIIQYVLIIILIIVISYFVTIDKIMFKHYMSYKYSHRSFKVVNISDIYDEFKSGDILLFKAYFVDKMHAVFNNCYFQHAAMIIKKNNLLYVIESNQSEICIPSDYRSNYGFSDFIPRNIQQSGAFFFKNGVNMIPLLSRIKYGTANPYVMRLNKNITNNMVNKLIKVSKSDHIHIGAGFKINLKKKSFHCFQYIAYVLDQMGLTNDLLKSSNILNVCNKVAQIYNEKLNDGYYYEKPVQIIYDL